MRMNIEDSWLIARFQRFITEFLIEKQLGQRRPELTDELYQAWREAAYGEVVRLSPCIKSKGRRTTCAPFPSRGVPARGRVVKPEA